MSKEIESVAAALFDKIRSRFPGVTLGDENAKSTTDTEKARFFNFKYTGEDGAEFSPVTISLIDETSLKVYYGQEITADMDREQRKEWYEFLRGIRKFAKRNLLTFDTRDLAKSNLALQDVKQQAKNDDLYTMSDLALSESRLYGRVGRPRLSVGEHGATKILVFHSEKVDEEKRGARTRKIESIFVETPIGERFKLESNNLRGAFGMAEHINQGGRVDDVEGKHITQLCMELAALKKFCRAMRNRTDISENEVLAKSVKKAVRDYEQTKHVVDQMRRTRFHRDYFESWIPTESTVTPDLDEMRERFARKVYDPRIEEALPVIASRLTEFETWAEDVAESTWLRPDTQDRARALEELLKSPIPSSQAGAWLKPLIGSDELAELLAQYQDQPDYDVRSMVKSWLQDNMPELAVKITIGPGNADDAATNWPAETSPQLAHPNDTYGATTMDDPVTDPNIPTVMQEDSLALIRQLSGLVK
jgi:hypothetical protein